MKNWNRKHALALIEREGRTKVWVSKYCGVRLETLNNYLMGRRNPPHAVVKLLAQCLNGNEQELLPVKEEYQAIA